MMRHNIDAISTRDSPSLKPTRLFYRMSYHMYGVVLGKAFSSPQFIRLDIISKDPVVHTYF